MSQSVLHWVLEDLISLAHVKYYKNGDSALMDKTPFNCYCVKELWTMIQSVIDHFKPNGVYFIYLQKYSEFWHS